MFTLQTPHVSKLSLSSPFFLINVSQKLGLREPIMSITGRTAGNPHPSGYGLLAHQHDQNCFARQRRPDNPDNGAQTGGASRRGEAATNDDEADDAWHPLVLLLQRQRALLGKCGAHHLIYAG